MSATRLYFSQGAAPIIPATWMGWGHLASPGTVYAAVLAKTGGALAAVGGATNIAYGGSVGVAQFVYGPIGAQTITGTVKGQVPGLEAFDGANATLALGIKIVTSAGVDRAVLLAAPTGASYLVGVPPEFPNADTGDFTNRRMLNSGGSTPITPTPQTAVNGDYLVIEVGFRFSASLNYGVMELVGDPVAGDLPEDDTTISSTLAPWIEFSGGIATGTPGTQVTAARAASVGWVVPPAATGVGAAITPASAAVAMWVVPAAVATRAVPAQVTSAAAASMTWVVPGATAIPPVAPPTPMGSLTLGQAKTALAARLGDPTNTFWTAEELEEYLVESLRTWNAYAAFYRDRTSFTTTPGQAFYDLRTVASSLVGQTVTTADLVQLLCTLLLEPAPVGTTWVGSAMFTTADLVTALNRRRTQFLLETGHLLTVTDLDSSADAGFSHPGFALGGFA